MKFIKGLGLLCFITLLSGSCFDAPEFPVIPEIEFDRIEIIHSADPSDFDTLNLYIKFKDGDGDLGFTLSPKYLSDPYHNANFYQEDAGGKLIPLGTEAGTIGEDEYELLHIPDPQKGKLVVYRTRKKAEFNFLPPADKCTGSNSLKHYEYLAGALGAPNPGGRRLLVRTEDMAAVDPLVELVDSFPKINPQYYQIRDTMYITPNPDHYNIEVDFLVKDPTAEGGFREFDWREEYCTTFDGRFPVLSDDPGSSIDGTLRYSMTSFGFQTIFSIKTLKLRVSIKDQQRHRSNVIYTNEFRF